MNKAQLLDTINKHQQFSAERLHKLAGGKQLTNKTLFQYLCELENWKPLEVIPTTDPNWVLVASSSEIGVWRKTSVVNQSCNCSYNSNQSLTPCCHLSAAMAAEENRWIDEAQKFGFTITVNDGKYQINDRDLVVGELVFLETRWVLSQPQSQPMKFEGAIEAIEYLALKLFIGFSA